ncbi:MAG: hypothetical protein JWN04_4205 [Myxococcaceae bacterium]|nr:hypothetical protein [Myxococcaceae bacterium]
MGAAEGTGGELARLVKTTSLQFTHVTPHEQKATTSVALPRTVKDALKAHARRVGRSVSAILADAAVRELRDPTDEPTATARFVAQENAR